MTRSISAAGWSRTAPRGEIPAQVMTVVSASPLLPARPRACPTARSTSSRSETSQRKGWTRGCSAASVSRPASSTSSAATWRPRAAKVAAACRPMPLAAPVTSARPVGSDIFVLRVSDQMVEVAGAVRGQNLAGAGVAERLGLPFVVTAHPAGHDVYVAVHDGRLGLGELEPRADLRHPGSQRREPGAPLGDLPPRSGERGVPGERIFVLDDEDEVVHVAPGLLLLQ